jgi:hypothetical protein
MAKFKNVTTGNIVSTENKAAIALMEKSENYVAVKGGKPKDEKKSDEKAE